MVSGEDWDVLLLDVGQSFLLEEGGVWQVIVLYQAGLHRNRLDRAVWYLADKRTNGDLHMFPR